MQLDTLASVSICGSMNMQMSPASTHSLTQLRDPLVDNHTLIRLVPRSFLRLSLAHCSFKEKIHSNAVDL